MRALKRTREVSPRLDGSFESLLAQFSATTLELNPSLGTPEFSRRLTARAAEMLGARAAVLALAPRIGMGNCRAERTGASLGSDDPTSSGGVLAEQAGVPG